MKRGIRGSVVVESALVVGLIFVVIFGTLDIAIVGYDQMVVDSAAFTSAHYNTVGVRDTAGADHATVQILPQVPQSGITHPASPAPAAWTLVPVDYGYNGTLAEQTVSASVRVGGVAMMQPTLYESDVQKPSVAVLGKAISVAGRMIEPMWVENGLHFNVANLDVNGFIPTSTYQGDAFLRGENTPPYYVGRNILRHCPNPQPWPAATPPPLLSGLLAVAPLDCVGPTDVIVLGVAEHLDWSNWGAQKPGADGSPPSSTSTSNSDNAGLVNGTTFAQTSCHQKYLATVAVFLQSIQASLPTIMLKSPLQPGINNFDVWTGFPILYSGASGANSAVQTIYKWDTIAQATPPSGYAGIGSTPLSPGLQC